MGRLGVTDGHRAVFPQQQQRHGLTDDVAAAHHNAVFSRNIDFIFPQQGHHSCRRTGQKPLLTGDDLTYVERMKCVYIFIWPNGVQHLFLGNMLRQGQLHQNAVHPVIFIEHIDQLQKLRLTGLRRQTIALA